MWRNALALPASRCGVLFVLGFHETADILNLSEELWSGMP